MSASEYADANNGYQNAVRELAARARQAAEAAP
jgi:hypothetical protein